jgi:hypothetical protein
MHARTILPAIAAGAVLLAVASCTDQTDPSTPDDLTPDAAIARQGSPDDPNALARSVPGFGGFYFDAQGAPTIYLKDAGRRADAERALSPYLRSRGLGAGQLKVKRADYDWAQLEAWFTSASAEALAVPGAVSVDADEASNRVRIGVEPGAMGRVRSALARLRMPDGAVIIEEREPVTFAVGTGPGPRPKAKPGSGASLQGTWRPTVGGVQINFPGFLCTLGFNVGGGSFITNSHCTTTQGGRPRPPSPARSRPRRPTRPISPVAPARPTAGAAAATPRGRATSTASPSSRSARSPRPIARAAR